MMRYYTSGGRFPRQRRQVEKYVLFGDPTLYIHGTNGYGNPHRMPKKEDVENQSQEPNEFFTVYPTVTDGYIYISMSDKINANIKVFSVNGSVVSSFNDVTTDIPVSLASLPDGIYIITANLQEGQIFHEKVIVKH
jgi:hypothetical protein